MVKVKSEALFGTGFLSKIFSVGASVALLSCQLMKLIA